MWRLGNGIDHCRPQRLRNADIHQPVGLGVVDVNAVVVAYPDAPVTVGEELVQIGIGQFQPAATQRTLGLAVGSETVQPVVERGHIEIALPVAGDAADTPATRGGDMFLAPSLPVETEQAVTVSTHPETTVSGFVHRHHRTVAHPVVQGLTCRAVGRNATLLLTYIDILLSVGIQGSQHVAVVSSHLRQGEEVEAIGLGIGK